MNNSDTSNQKRKWKNQTTSS